MHRHPVRQLATLIAVSALVCVTGAGAAAAASPTVAAPACADPAAGAKLLLSKTPAGPAADAITGHSVTRAFSLESGDFVASPPPAGYAPAVTAAQAGCNLTAAVGISGFGAPAGRLALATVTIAPGLPQASSTGSGQPFAIAHVGALPAYEHRVAWILVSTANNDVSSCPEAAAAPATVPASPYEIFAIDATTGAAAIEFEDSFTLCTATNVVPASVSVPYETTSVPWSLVWRNPNKKTATITASWSSCEVYTLMGDRYAVGPPGHPTKPVHQGLQAWVGNPTQHQTTIVVTRPFGPSCGPAHQHLLTLHPERVGLDIPTHLVHGRLSLEPSNS